MASPPSGDQPMSTAPTFLRRTKSGRWSYFDDEAGMPIPMTTPDPPERVPEPPVIRQKDPRPAEFSAFVGNTAAVQSIQEAITAGRRRGWYSHLLLFGPPGMGKTTLAKLAARAMGGPFVETTASVLEKQSDVLKVLMELNAAATSSGSAGVLFIDEIHRLGTGQGRSAVDQEAIFSLLEDLVFHHSLGGEDLRMNDRTEIIAGPSPYRL